MSNLIALSAKVIPYSGYLRKITKSVASAILFQQMEYWFDKKGNSFFKFLEPCEKNKNYKTGDSWVEELYFSKDEFRVAFDNIGVRYGSKKEYDKKIKENKDPFDGSYYCSYHDKISGLTWYFRNDRLIKNTIDLLTKDKKTEVRKANFRKSTKPTSVNRQSQLTEVGKPNVQYTESITESTTVYKEKRELPKNNIEQEIITLIENDILKFSSLSSNSLNYSLKNQQDLQKLISEYPLTQIKEAIPKVKAHPKFGDRFSYGGYLMYVKDFLYSEIKKEAQPVNNLLTKPKVKDGEYDGSSHTKMAYAFSD